MIFTKVFETQIDLKKPEEIYGNKELIVKQKLEDDFVNRCYFGTLILEILDIIEWSKCQITDASNTGFGYMSVRFTAKVYQINQGEMIMGKVLMVEDNRIQCLEIDNRAAVILRRVSGIKSIKKDQIIPIKVQQTMYTLSQSQVSVSGTFYFVPKQKATVYNIGALKKEDIISLEPLLASIKDLEKELSKVSKTTFNFFSKLLYPFEKENKPGLTKADMKKLTASGYVVRHETIDKSTSDIYILKKSDNSIEQPALLVYQMFLTDYINHMQSLLLLCKTYGTAELQKKNSNLWDIYKAYKKIGHT